MSFRSPHVSLEHDCFPRVIKMRSNVQFICTPKDIVFSEIGLESFASELRMAVERWYVRRWPLHKCET